ncbi:MAG: histidinol dehydrogenase, partial [Candidatus Amulumruptor sp.]|nr:histidinol dehydrogenase [Candidatus Amulumruptor sp.]
MEIFEYPERERWGALCRRNFREEESIDGKVIEIINKVVSEGDAALRELAMKYEVSGEKLSAMIKTADTQ